MAATVVIKNTTPSFANTIDVVWPRDPASRRDVLTGEGGCVDTSQSGGGAVYNEAFGPIRPDGVVYDTFWWVIDSYYSPAHPKGDWAAFTQYEKSAPLKNDVFVAQMGANDSEPAQPVP
jgi:hypothetical protein